MGIRDTRMMARSLQQRWPMSPEQRQLVIDRLVGIVADPLANHREVTSAAKALMSAEGQNQKDEHTEDAADDDRNRFLAIATRLGLAAGVAGITDRRTGGGVIDARIVETDQDGRTRVPAAADEQAEEVRPRHNDPAAGEPESPQ